MKEYTNAQLALAILCAAQGMTVTLYHEIAGYKLNRRVDALIDQMGLERGEQNETFVGCGDGLIRFAVRRAT